MSDDRRILFAIVTWGATASHWLSKILNSHPEVFCVHHLSNIITTKLPVYRRFLTPYRVMELCDLLGQGYTLAGNCHGSISVEHIPEIRHRLGDNFRAVGVTRHPILRMRSAIALAKKTDFLDYRTARRAFKSYMKAVNEVTLEVSEFKVFKMEDLTTNRNALNELLLSLSDGRLNFDKVEIDLEKRIFSHSEAQDADPSKVFESFEDWQKEQFADLLSYGARYTYEKLGYDLSLIPDRS